MRISRIRLPSTFTLHPLKVSDGAPGGCTIAPTSTSGARAYLERSLATLQKVLGTDEHPDVAASLHQLANILYAEGRANEAVSTFRRVLGIEEKLYGSLDQYHSAETEIPLGMLLIQLGREHEGMPHILHAMQVLATQIPNHPSLGDLRRFLQSNPP